MHHLAQISDLSDSSRKGMATLRGARNRFSKAKINKEWSKQKIVVVLVHIKGRIRDGSAFFVFNIPNRNFQFSNLD